MSRSALLNGICDKCASSLSTSSINEIIPSMDEEISLNGDSNFYSSNYNDSLNSKSTSSNINYHDIN